MADSIEGLLGPVNWGSNVVNGQLIPQAPTSAWFPLTMGNNYTGPKWPTLQPYGVPPTISSSSIGGVPQSMGVAPTQAGSSSGSSSLWHPTKGTIFFGLAALIIGLFMLHYIHYGREK